MLTSKNNKLISHIKLDDNLSRPKYLQLAEGISTAIEEGLLKHGDILPSINDLYFNFNISRPTAEHTYSFLKQKGMIESYPGKGFFVNYPTKTDARKILLLFNKLSVYKTTIYDAFVSARATEDQIRLFIYNNDVSTFKKILDNNTSYDHYVIIPPLQRQCSASLKSIITPQKDRILLLNRCLPEEYGDYAGVFENFKGDIYGALCKASVRLRTYDILKFVFPQTQYFPTEILSGFIDYCHDNNFTYDVLYDLKSEVPTGRVTYITLTEDDLVTLTEKVYTHNFKVGVDIGIISYNESALKSVLLNGITTMTTDFEQMGRLAAQEITNQSGMQIWVPFHINIRNSL